MKFAILKLILGCGPLAFGSNMWQTVSQWVPLSPKVAARVQQTWSELQSDPAFTSDLCPYPGDQAFAERELPWVMLDPKAAISYTAGQPEMLLNAISPHVSVNILCTNGKIGLVDVISFNGVWKPAQVYHGSAPQSKTGLLQIRLQDQTQSGLPINRYFGIEIKPNDVGGGRIFSGAFLLARETDQDVMVISIDPIPEIGLAPRVWTNLNDVILSLQKKMGD